MSETLLGLILLAAPPSPPATDSEADFEPAPPATSKLPGATPAAVAPAPFAVPSSEPPAAPELVSPLEPETAVVVETYHWEKTSSAWPPPVSRPIRWRVDPFLELGTLTVVDRGYRAIDDGRNSLQLGVGLRVDARVRGPLFLGAGLHYARASGDTGPYDAALSTGFTAHAPMASLRASIVFVEGLDVVAALEGGPQFVHAYVDSSIRATSSKRVLGAFSAKAGVSLYLPKAWYRRRGAARFTGGLNLMMGYGAGTRLRLRPRPDVADDAIRTEGTALGDVRMHGYVWSLGLFVRFM